MLSVTKHHGHRLLMLLALIVVYIVIRSGQVKQTVSDPQLTLLTAQAIVENGSLKLTPYKNALPESQFSNGDWKYFYRNGDVFYTYPLGTSLLCVPAVFLANKLGMDMTIREHDERLQLILAAFICILILIQLTRLLRFYFEEWQAFVIALLFFFGTSLVSSMGTALWSFGTELLFVTEVLIEIVAIETGTRHIGKQPAIRPWRMGIFLFLAWLCRPSALSFIAIVFIWMLWRKAYRDLLKTGAAALAGVVLFSIFSMSVYGNWLPPYYDPMHWAIMSREHSSFYVWMGLWFSPARGLFIFTPGLFLFVAGIVLPAVRKNRLTLFALIWFLLHTLLLIRNGNWWGGWSYGPRLYSDALPAFLLLFAIGLPEVLLFVKKSARKLVLGFTVLCAFAGIYIHAVQGLMNTATVSWNMGPEIDDYTDFYIFNWNYPQFAATEQTNQQKRKEFELRNQLRLWKNYLPENSLLYIGAEDAGLRRICKNINADAAGSGHVTLSNSFDEITAAGITDFYMLRGLQDSLLRDTTYQLQLPKKVFRLDEYLKLQTGQLVILSVKDEATNQLSPESRSYLRSAGAQIDSLHYRQGYLLVIGYDKKVIMEKFDLGEGATLELKTKTGKNIKLASKGNAAGNYSSVLYGTDELSLNERGINVVVLDKKGRLTASVNFDTHIADRLQTPVLHIKKK